MADSRRIGQGSEDVLLIWLDSNINEKSSDYRKTITEFQRVIDSVKTFTDGDECIQFIDHLHNEKAFIVISGSLGQRLISKLHDLTQIESIFVFCGDRKRHEQWAKEWVKIKGVFTEIPPLCDALREAFEQNKQNKIPVSIMTATSGSGISFASVNQLDPSFMYTQILKEILLSIEFDQSHFQEFIDYCRELFVDNGNELQTIKEFEKRYREYTPVWWYTRECFLYRTVNRSLRTMEVNAIIKMGFYICDLDRQLKQLHSEQFKGHDQNSRLILYRGQGLSKVDFERLSQTKGGLLSFNNFLTTHKDRQVALAFAENARTNPHLLPILFVMTIDPSLSTTPFASIDQVSNFPGEHEVLFSMHSIFRVVATKEIDVKSHFFEVKLELTSDTDPDLQTLTDYLRKDVCQHSNGWYRLCRLLPKMGHFDTAQNIYERLLKETPDEREKGNLYHHIGSIKTDQGNYQEAIKYFEKALSIYEKTLPPKHPHLASSYNNIGLAYGKINEYSKALEAHENALKIYQKIRPSNHPDLASTFNNIGLVHNGLKEYDEALSFHEKALAIRQQTLPPNHPDIAASYNNLGLVCRNLGEFSKALSNYERALEIGQHSLPLNHPDLKLYEKNRDSAKKKC